MPKAAYQKDDHNIDIFADISPAVSAKRKIQIITKPEGK